MMKTTFIVTHRAIEVVELLRYLSSLDFKFLGESAFSIRSTRIPVDIEMKDLSSIMRGDCVLRLDEAGDGVKTVALHEYHDLDYPDMAYVVHGGCKPIRLIYGWDHEVEQIKTLCSEYGHGFYNGFKAFVLDTTLKLNDLDPTWGYAAGDQVVVRVDQQVQAYNVETMSTFWPDELRCRVFIGGKYYYFL